MYGLCGWKISDIFIVLKFCFVNFGWLVVVEGGRVLFIMCEKLMLLCLRSVLFFRMWV